MAEAITTWSACAAFLVSGFLFAWCLIRGARSAPSLLLALLLGSFAIWNLFEWLWWLTDRKFDNFLKLEFVGISLAPCLAFHYALSLSGPFPSRRWALMAAYSGTAYFLGTAVAAVADRSATRPFTAIFMSEAYNAAYLTFFIPVVVATLWMLERGRKRARDPRARSLFAFPLAAGLLMFPLGFLELAIPVFGWEEAPRLASLGALAGSVLIGVGILRYRIAYDVIALLRRDIARVLRATVQGVLYVEGDGRIIFSTSVARDLLGSEPKTLAEAGLEPLPSRTFLVRRGDRLIEVRVVKSAEVLPPGRRTLILQDRTKEYGRMRALASSEALASLGQGAATLAHEIRNPLTAINSALECIVHDTAEGARPQERHLDLIRGEVRRLNDLLDRTLELSRPLKVDLRPCDLNALVKKVVEIGPGTNGSHVTLRLASELPAVQGDPDLLGQLLLNLFRNAAEASAEVRIVTERAPDGVLLRVSSPGARIPDEVLPHLFEPFVTTKVKGTGLGLALSKKVASAHGAEITGRNTDEGVDFEVRFPA